MDVYVVLDGGILVGVSAKLQGAELLRGNRAVKLADQAYTKGSDTPDWRSLERQFYDRQQIVNTDLQDAE